MEPDCDIYAQEEEEDEFGRTRSISREELLNLQESRKPARGSLGEEELRDDHPDPSSRNRRERKGPSHLTSRQKDKDVSTQFERIVTAIGMQFSFVMTGSVLAETVFAWPGIGRLIVDAINKRDTPTVTGSIILCCVMMALINLATDIVYAFCDPRIKAQYSNKR